MPTLNDIARIAQVSPATVSRALNGQEKGVRTKAAQRARTIRKLARDLGYTPVAGATDQPSSLRGHAAFVMRDVYTSACDFEFISGATTRLQEEGFSLTVLTLAELSMRGPLLLHDKPFDFLIVRHVPAEWRRTIEEMAERCVWLDTNEWRPTLCLRRDEYQAAYLATTKMIEAGYEHLIYLGSDVWQEAHFNVVERRAGAEQAAQDLGRSISCLAISAGQPCPDRAAELTRLLSPRLAVLATDSSIAQWCAHQATAAGLVPGRDFGLASCCETGGLHWMWPQLSRVTFDRRGLGGMAAEMQLKRLADPDDPCTSIKIQGEWVAGETIRPASA